MKRDNETQILRGQLSYNNYMKSDEQLKKENPELYRIAREKGTERAFQGKYVDTKEDGMYHCAVCDAELFSAKTKFDSGSGWPSFTDPATQEVLELIEDTSHGMNRTEVVCKGCGAHLGHVFDDGPRKMDNTCNRFCINSISLDLKTARNLDQGMYDHSHDQHHVDGEEDDDLHDHTDHH